MSFSRAGLILKTLILAGLSAVALSACASSPGTGDGFARGLDDTSASMAVRARMMRSYFDFDRASVTVVGGLALLTGRVADEAARAEAERIAWSAPKVRDVANELIVDDGPRPNYGVNDQWLSGQVRARLMADGHVRNASINVETYEGVVYLLGHTRTEGEAQRAATNASLVPGVARVVSFIRIGSELVPDARAAHTAPPAPAAPAPSPAPAATSYAAPPPAPEPAPAAPPASAPASSSNPDDNYVVPPAEPAPMGDGLDWSYEPTVDAVANGTPADLTGEGPGR